MHDEDEGAYTGEIAPGMLSAAGCSHVILGHSERRKLFGETDQGVNRKVKKAIAAGLLPIMCVGESLEDREKGVTGDVVTSQVKGGLEGVDQIDIEKLIVAYEPVWAIGTGKTATPEQAQEVHSTIRDLIGSMYSKEVADKVVVQYGGSVKPENAAELLGQPDIDGALVGGACLKPDSFLSIIKSAVK
jgi:triosephosphate isomerase